MKKNNLIIAALLILTVFGGMYFSACVKQSYDTPPNLATYDPTHPPIKMSLGALATRALNLNTGVAVALGDSTLYGIVTADDRSGNFYHQIVIQDTTGGMTIDIDATYLYNSYPIGRKVYVNLSGLYLANYHGLPQICAGIDPSTGKTINIPSPVASNAIIAASFPDTVSPVQLRLKDVLSNPQKYLNILVTLTDVQFDSNAANHPYAGSISSGTSTSLNVLDCQNNSLVLYNSNYASFQPVIAPNGNGSLTGIFSIYGSSQFLIRDTFDVRMNGARVSPCY